MNAPLGLHHVTCIAGPAQENLDFYAGILGMRLVKKSVNQDDPGTYHLFYADAEGRPGTDLTFFPWTHMPKGQKGIGLAVEIVLAVPEGSLGFWEERLRKYGVATGGYEARFGEKTLKFVDVHGLEAALVETSSRQFTPWEKSPVPPQYQIRGLDSARLWERELAPTQSFLTGVVGFKYIGRENNWHRFALGGGGSGKTLDLQELPDTRRGRWGVGSIHHLARRVEDEAHQRAVREQVEAAGRRPTPSIDRFWFKSVYFSEPGGVLFELATDGPGFSVDEDPKHLGETLVLPPWLEQRRQQIELVLPPLQFSDKFPFSPGGG